MATARPRIQFVPTERTRALLDQISGLTGQSVASLAAEILDEAAPVIQGQLEAIRKIAGRPHEAKQYFEEYAAKATADIAQVTMEFTSELDAKSQQAKLKRRVARARPKP
jgi:hypothetical protein